MSQGKSREDGPGLVTGEGLDAFLAVGSDKRRAILRGWGLDAGHSHDWTTIWARLGLTPVQKRRTWDDLRAPLLTSEEVAGIIGRRPDTVRDWCRQGMYPAGFPPPFDLGPRTRRWIELEVWAWRQPEVRGSLARQIARPAPSARAVLRPPGAGPIPTTLKPMPFA